MIKLIVTDLDGTLFYPLNKIKGVSKENRNFLRNFLDNNGDVMIASGRNLGFLSKLEKTMKHKLYFMGCNGSYVVDKETKKISNRHPLDSSLIAKLYLSMKDNYSIFCYFLLDESNKLYYFFPEGMPKYLTRAFKVGNFLNLYYRENLIGGEAEFLKKAQDGKNYKLMPVFSFGKSNQEKTVQTYIALKSIFGDSLNLCMTGGSIEITGKDVSKGNGLKDFIAQKGIKEDEVIVIGDAENDISMFKNFRHSFCMSHSDDETKKWANHIVDYVYQIEDFLKNPALLEKDEIKNI